MEVDNANFVNVYINILNKELEDATKQKVVLMAKEKYNAILIENLNQRVRELETTVVDYEKVKSEVEHTKNENLNLKSGVIEVESLRKTLSQTKDMLKKRERELEILRQDTDKETKKKKNSTAVNTATT